MTQYHVPLIIRGRIIDDKDVEFGGRHGGATFTAPDVKKHADLSIVEEAAKRLQ